MIIETLTGFTAVKFVWETLEILHLIHVGKISGDAACKGVGSISHLMQEQINKWKKQINPGRQCEIEAKTPYDFTSIDDDNYQKTKEKADSYLTKLNHSVESLKNAKIYFLKIYKSVIQLAAKDKKTFLSNLLDFKIKFQSFKDELNQFLLSIEIPPRQLLYIANLSNQRSGSGELGVIEKFNGYLEDIKACFNEMEYTKKDMFDKLKEGFILNPESADLNLSEQFQHSIDQLSEIMPAIPQENTKYLTVREAMVEISAVFQQTDIIEDQVEEWASNPNWWPLLTEEKQIEVGQRIFLHVMDQKNSSADKKLLIAQIFLRQHVSKYAFDQATIDLLAHELAILLCALQIEKCESLIGYLKKLELGTVLPDQDPDGLLEWLKTKRMGQCPTKLFIEILVEPYCFNKLCLESALPRLKEILPDESAEILIENYKESSWGSIREKSDALIQLSKSFKVKLLPRDYILKDKPFENTHVVSKMMHQLAEKLVKTLESLTGELKKNYNSLDGKLLALTIKQEEVSELKQNQEHKNGVARIKKFHQIIKIIKSPTNILFSYLYKAKTINENEKKQQVATVDDLLYVIYKGLDPNGVCFWKSSSSQPHSECNQLLYYFLQNQQDDSRAKACIYAFHDCQARSAPLFGNLLSFIDRPLLALENTPSSAVHFSAKNVLSIDVILKDPNKICSICDDSKALKEVSPENKQEAETALKQLQNYQVLALTRINPKYIHKLPFIEQLKHLIQNLFKSTWEIRQERLESVRIFIGDLCTVLSLEDTEIISHALNNFKRNYDGRYNQAKNVYKSVLYKIMLRLVSGPIAELISHFPVQEQKQFRIEENKSELQETINELREHVSELIKEKEEAAENLEEAAENLKESEAKRLQAQTKLNKVSAKLKAVEMRLQEVQAERLQDQTRLQEVQAERLQDQTRLQEVEAKLDKLLTLSKQQPEPASNSLRSDANTSENSHIRFFKS